MTESGSMAMGHTDPTIYRPRLADRELEDSLAAAGAVLIEGAKGCGKTATARRAARSEVFLDADPSVAQAMAVDPRIVLAGETPRLLDEWQAFPDLWNYVRRAVDLQSGKGRFILTGSAVPADDVMRHSGAGRITRLRMHTMSLFEQGRANGAVSLGGLLSGVDQPSAPDPGLALSDLVEAICRGGWPGTLDDGLPQAMRFVRGYVDEVRRTDVERTVQVRHDPNRVLRLLQSLARNTATTASLATLAADVAGRNEVIQPRTIGDYIDALRRLFVVEALPPFAAHLRSRARLRQADKQHFSDPSIGVAALRSSPERLLADLAFLGFLFESLVVRDLRAYAAVHDAGLRHYRDSNGLQVDIIVETAAGIWLPVEVKLGSTPAIVDEAAASLLRFRDTVDSDRMGEAPNLLVVTGMGYAYRRPDGVTVAPIGALGP